MSEEFHISPLPLLPIVRLSAIAVGAAVLAGTAGLLATGHGAALPVMLASFGVVWAAALLALLPLAWANQAPTDRLIGGCMLMMITRMNLTFGGAAVLVLAGVSLQAALVWVLPAYLLLLVVEVAAVVKRLSMQQRERAILSKESAA